MISSRHPRRRTARVLLLFGTASLIACATAGARSPSSARSLSERIDAYFAETWSEAGVKPAPPCDDATFLRRVYLDLVGHVPTVAETRKFLANGAPDKRARLVRKLLASGGHAGHAATLWRRVWMPQADTPEFAGLADDFESWIAVRLRDGSSYDALVRELVTTSRMTPTSASASGTPTVSPIGFQAASQYRPENLAANSARAFLGLNLDCAQCHDHPFARWTQEEFWQTAAFFARPIPAHDESAVKLAIMLPDQDRSLEAAFLDDEVVRWPESVDADTGRILLAEWMTDPENDYFARNAVNRVWAELYGVGLVEPLDDLTASNPSRYSDLLEELAAAFREGDYDLRSLIEALVLTKAYQASTDAPTALDGLPLSSESLEPGGAARFASMPVRALNGEQLYDSLLVAASLPVERADLLGEGGSDQRDAFTTRMYVGRASQAERSIVQSLALMNGSLVRDLSSPTTNPLLAATVESPFQDVEEKIETLFLATLCRPPSPEESARLTEYVESSASRTAGDVFGDVVWMLLNTSEFATNH